MEKTKDLGGMLRSVKLEVAKNPDPKFVGGVRNIFTAYFGKTSGGNLSKYADAHKEGLDNLITALLAAKDSPTGAKITFHFGEKQFESGTRATTGYFFVSIPASDGSGGATRTVVTPVSTTSDVISKLESEALASKEIA